jgi:hypothetical protein
MFSLIDSSRLLAVKAAFLAILKETSITQIEQMSGGYSSSQMYKVLTDNNTYVLRVMGLDQQIEDRDQQSHVYKSHPISDWLPKFFIRILKQASSSWSTFAIMRIRKAFPAEYDDIYRMGFDAWCDGQCLEDYLDGCRSSPKYKLSIKT